MPAGRSFCNVFDIMGGGQRVRQRSSELSECDGDPDKPFEDDEKERKRLDHNTKRRTARNTPGTSAYELHKLKATRKAERNRPGVVQYLISELEHELTRRLDVEACFLPDRPHIDTLRALVAVQRRHDMVVQIPDDHAMWTSFEPVARMLVGMAKDPLAFNAREWVERGFLVQEANLPDEDDSRAVVVFRVLNSSRSVVSTYCKAIPRIPLALHTTLTGRKVSRVPRDSIRVAL
ncbi:hypothetical protein PLICRDRAFT_244194 [Plicaturopsis crispa FD-325 SS-3]|nr:hypothetical protein PLICRDRAFT_244194 [Plicaturopsis crispa FD-325 SS-3]